MAMEEGALLDLGPTSQARRKPEGTLDEEVEQQEEEADVPAEEEMAGWEDAWRETTDAGAGAKGSERAGTFRVGSTSAFLISSPRDLGKEELDLGVPICEESRWKDFLKVVEAPGLGCSSLQELRSSLHDTSGILPASVRVSGKEPALNFSGSEQESLDCQQGDDKGVSHIHDRLSA
ncbi:hypothetical protein E2320_014376 [Naja naja]|nr:hypothetical protein E2320_014376 [Naja naja]